MIFERSLVYVYLTGEAKKNETKNKFVLIFSSSSTLLVVVVVLEILMMRTKCIF